MVYIARLDGFCLRHSPGLLGNWEPVTTGIGIPKELQRKLFKPFERLSFKNSNIEGTGIGLVICKRIVQMMNGRIGLESKVNEGSTFWVELPLIKYLDQDENLIIKSNLKSQSKIKDEHQGVIKTVLYIEDNPANIKLMQSIIDRINGVNMISVHTGELGIETAIFEKPDMILLDINLPGISGFDVLKYLKSNETTKNIPIIAVSAYATKNDIQMGLDAGFKEYLPKPLDVISVTHAIR
jgi:CheY-like chemotaxis protein